MSGIVSSTPFAPGEGPRVPSFVYVLVCAVVGLAISWLPMLVHGPIAEKWSYFYLDGRIMVWGWYLARAMIGLLVGLSALPEAWWYRGPLCGALAMLPLGLVSLGNIMCGPP
jgi:hypothetical protein